MEDELKKGIMALLDAAEIIIKVPPEFYAMKSKVTLKIDGKAGIADSILALLAPELGAAERYRDALIHIEEYWNRDCNDTAMRDALYEIVETAQTALEGEREQG